MWHSAPPVSGGTVVDTSVSFAGCGCEWVLSNIILALCRHLASLISLRFGRCAAVRSRAVLITLYRAFQSRMAHELCQFPVPSIAPVKLELKIESGGFALSCFRSIGIFFLLFSVRVHISVMTMTGSLWSWVPGTLKLFTCSTSAPLK